MHLCSFWFLGCELTFSGRVHRVVEPVLAVVTAVQVGLPWLAVVVADYLVVLFAAEPWFALA